MHSNSVLDVEVLKTSRENTLSVESAYTVVEVSYAYAAESAKGLDF